MSETAGDVAQAALRGAIAAMAMTGMRVVTVNLGIVEQTPPDAILRKRARGLIRRVPRGHRRAAVELFHWSFGAGGGVAFRMLPESMRFKPWAGPVYGVAVWLGFELGIAPVLGLSQAVRPRVQERLALAGDHLLYGFVLSETRRQARD